MATENIIIIKRPKHGHGHHGGAWKVAYADFVTAMMALFIVLWLMSSNDDVKKAVGGYFSDPKGIGKQAGNGQAGHGESLLLQSKDLGKIKERIETELKKDPALQELMKKQVQMVVTGEGLRIELMESDKGVFFESGNATPTGGARDLLAKVAAELGNLKNKVLVEGHTDAKPFNAGASYSNWELSADRANATRRFMQANGLRSDQVTQVRGYGDQKLKIPAQPHDPRNRRISIVVQYGTPTAAELALAEKASAEKNRPNRLLVIRQRSHCEVRFRVTSDECSGVRLRLPRACSPGR